MNYLGYLVGGIFISLFVWVTARSLYLRWWGIATTGIIVAFETDTSSEGQDTHKPVVAFTTQEGLRVEAKSMYGTPTTNTYFRLGETVALRYAARNPACFAIDGYEVSAVLFTFFFALMGVLIIWQFS
jgi:hypothetical protein